MTAFAVPTPSASALALSDAELEALQGEVSTLPSGRRIAFWADRFAYGEDMVLSGKWGEGHIGGHRACFAHEGKQRKPAH
ncbi:MAG TPA: hypothetical protein VLH56_01460 [Dissulfurispiraceae bacterium]|nr:hypothetical protein [Dissulfurispiraceae bacterium]